jgi:hypothetical protein
MPPPARSAPATHADLLGPPPPAYQRLQAQLTQSAWICHGTVVARRLLRSVRGRPVQKGPYCLWTCKVKNQTRCVALSPAQYQLLAQAIQNYHQLQKTLARMQALTLKTILQKVPGVQKRK